MKNKASAIYLSTHVHLENRTFCMTRGTIGEVKILFIIACVVLKSEDNHRLIKNEMQKNLAMILIIDRLQSFYGK